MQNIAQSPMQKTAQSTIKMSTAATSSINKSKERTNHHRPGHRKNNDQHGRPMLQLLPTEIRLMIISNLFTMSLTQIPQNILETQDFTLFIKSLRQIPQVLFEAPNFVLFTFTELRNEREDTTYTVEALATTSDILRHDIIHILNKHTTGLQSLLKMQCFLAKLTFAEKLKARNEVDFCERLVRNLKGPRCPSPCGGLPSFNEKKMESGGGVPKGYELHDNKARKPAWKENSKCRLTGTLDHWVSYSNDYRALTTTEQKGRIDQGEAGCAPGFNIPHASTAPKLQDIHDNSIRKIAWQQKTKCTPTAPPVRKSGSVYDRHEVVLAPTGRPGRTSKARSLVGTNSSLVMDPSRNVLHAEDKNKKITPGLVGKSRLQGLIDSIGQGRAAI